MAWDFGHIGGKRFNKSNNPYVSDSEVYQGSTVSPMDITQSEFNEEPPSSVADFRRMESSTPDDVPLIDMRKLLSSHESTNAPAQSEEPNYKAAWINGTLGSLLGRALTPLAEKITGKKVDLSTLPEQKTLGEKAVSFAGSNLSDLPLWLAGDAALAKPLSALAKTAPIAKAASVIPKALLPALGTGVRAGGTFGGVIAPAETVVEGDGLQGLLQREKQVPFMALGGVALHGGSQILGKGISEAGNALTDRRLGQLTQPLDEAVQNAFRKPLLESKAEPLQLSPKELAYKNRQAELSDTFKDLPIGSVDTPLARNTLQQNIDNSMGIGKPAEGYGGLEAFGKPLKTFTKNNDAQNTVAEISTKMDERIKGFESMIKQADEQTPIGSIRKKILDMGGIKQGNGDIFEEQKVIPNWIKNNTTGRPLDEVADTIGMSSGDLLRAVSDSKYVPRDYVAEAQAMANKDPEYLALGNTLETMKGQLPGKRTLDALPKLKPRELSLQPEPLPIQPPRRMTLSGSLPEQSQPTVRILETPSRSILTNESLIKDRVPFQGLREVPTSAEIPKVGNPTPISEPLKPLGDRSAATAIESPAATLTLRGPGGVNVPRVEPVGIKRLSFPDTVAKGEITDPVLAEQLKNTELNYGNITNKDTLEVAKQYIQKDKDAALHLVMSDTPSTAESNAVAQLLIKEANDAGKFGDAISIIEKTSQKARSQGQAIQALSMWGRLSPEGILKYADGIVKKANEAGKTTATKLDEKVAGDLVEQSNAIQGMVEGSRERQVATAKMLDTVAAQVPPSFLQKVATLQTMAQLVNPKTALRNLIGNTGFSAMENASQVLGTGIDKAASLFTKQRTMSLPSLKTQVSGAKAGWKLGLDDAMKGIDTSGLGSQFDINPNRTFRKGILGKAETAMNVELRAPDRAFYQSAYDDSLRSQMKAAKVAEPTDAMKEIADYDGKYRTFQDKNYLSELFSTFKQKLNGDKDFGAGDFILKYPKTPANLLARGIDYSPAGFIKTVMEASKPLMGKEFDQRSFVNAFSRATVGSTGLVGMGALLHRTGIISGARDQDPDVAALNDSVGLGQYKINVSALKRFVLGGFDTDAAKLQKGDTLATYDWFQPQALPIAMGADIDKNGAKAQGMVGTLLNGLATGVNAFAEQPVMQGLQTLVGQRDFSDGITKILQGVPASFVPTLLNQAKQLLDNQKRNTYSPNWTEKTANLSASKIPLLETKLQPSYDALGNKAETYQNGSNSPLNVLANPSFVSKYSPSKEAELALNAYNQTGETKQIPTVVPKYFTVTDQRIDLTAEEYAEMQRIVGEKTKKEFGVISPGMSMDNQIDKMAKAIEKARFEGKKYILDGRGIKYIQSGNTLKLRK